MISEATLPGLQQAMRDAQIDGWLLYDFRAQNPVAMEALGLGHLHLTRRFFYMVSAAGEPTLVVHAIERGNFPPLPGRVLEYAGYELLSARLRELLAPYERVAMEYLPLGAIPTLSRVDAGTVEWVRSLGPQIVSSADLVQMLLYRWDAWQVGSHQRAALGIDAAKDAAFRYIGDELRKGIEPREHEVQAFLMERFREHGLVTDSPPIVARGANAGNPHYAPSPERPTPIRRSDFVLIDLWAKEDDPRACWADITWTGVCGTPKDRHGEIFTLVAAARDAALDLVRKRPAGSVRGFEADRAARSVIAARGYGERFFHRTGHSIGATHVHGDGANLDDFETHDTRVLLEGTCFSIEPGVYLDDFGVRSEIDVVLSPEGPKVFSPIQRELVRVLD